MERKVPGRDCAEAGGWAPGQNKEVCQNLGCFENQGPGAQPTGAALGRRLPGRQRGLHSVHRRVKEGLKTLDLE